MIGILLAGFTGCGSQKAPDELSQLRNELAQLQKQLLEEKQEQETKKQKEAEEARMAQVAASVAEEKLIAFEAKLAEKEKEDRLAQLEKDMAKLEAQIAAQSNQPSWPPLPVCPYPGSVTISANFRAEVYKGDNFNEYVGLLPDPYPINFDWEYGGPFGLTNYFSVRWEGTPWLESGTYRFRVRADDGFRLYVGNQLLLDKWSPGTTRTFEVTRSLSGYHNVRLEYRELTGLSKVSLSWEKIQ
jgi:hypothetical protein